MKTANKPAPIHDNNAENENTAADLLTGPSVGANVRKPASKLATTLASFSRGVNPCAKRTSLHRRTKARRRFATIMKYLSLDSLHPRFASNTTGSQIRSRTTTANRRLHRSHAGRPSRYANRHGSVLGRASMKHHTKRGGADELHAWLSA